MSQTKTRPTIRRARESLSTKTYTFAGITLITVLVFLLGAISPTLSAISRIQNEVKEKEIIDDQLQNKINILTDLQNSVIEYEDDLEIIDTYFPLNSDHSVLMAGLERITTSYGFQMVSLSIKVNDGDEATDAYSGMRLVEVKVVGSGPRSQVSNLLEHFENMPVVPEITKVSYALDESYRTGFVGLSVLMNIYKMEL